MGTAILAALLTALAVGNEVRLVGPEQVEVGQSFEVSVEGLSFDLSIFTDTNVPPQVKWLVVPANGSLRSRMEVMIVMDDKPKWVVSPYVTVTLTNPGKVGIVLMVVQDGKGTLLVHEVTAGPFPDPIPPPPPDDKLTDIVIIEETSQRTPELARVLTSKKVSAFIDSSGLDFVAQDQHVVDEHGKTPESYQPYIDAAKKLGMPTLFLIGEKGTTFYEGTMPKTPDAFIELVKQYAKGNGDW